ncbi:MAG: KamA family radical SAM protein [Planctomycetia bacterium]|nr:KamA family radical SAM protein [Planctomycetia bacterium]
MSFPVDQSTDYITNLKELCEVLNLPEFLKESGEKAEAVLPLKIPYSLLDRMEKGNPDDPILLQFLPDNNELKTVTGYTNDPLNEENVLLQPGILQKYQNRALILTNDFCAAQCRFCFRRTKSKNPTLYSLLNETEKFDFSSFICPETTLSKETDKRFSPGKQNDCWNRFFQAIRDDSSISEIILSGGDPLASSNKWLKTLCHYIKTIAHVKRVRFHSRLPILIPERIDDHFPLFEKGIEKNSNNQPVYYLVFHINHPNELNDRVYKMFDRLLLHGVVLMSQTVLLRRINDNASVLEKLFDDLINHRVIPYYLHQLDKVQGAADFEVPIRKGLDIMRQLRQRLPGYAVPNYVQEMPGTDFKQNLENIETNSFQHDNN